LAGEKHPGKGDVLKLAQMAEVVRNRQPPLTRPFKSFIELPLVERVSQKLHVHYRLETPGCKAVKLTAAVRPAMIVSA
jgi:hypothetical protein